MLQVFNPPSSQWPSLPDGALYQKLPGRTRQRFVGRIWQLPLTEGGAPSGSAEGAGQEALFRAWGEGPSYEQPHVQLHVYCGAQPPIKAAGQLGRGGKSPGRMGMGRGNFGGRATEKMQAQQQAAQKPEGWTLCGPVDFLVCHTQPMTAWVDAQCGSTGSQGASASSSKGGQWPVVQQSLAHVVRPGVDPPRSPVAMQDRHGNAWGDGHAIDHADTKFPLLDPADESSRHQFVACSSTLVSGDAMLFAMLVMCRVRHGSLVVALT